MNHGNFDERCPHCSIRIMGMSARFESHDYATDFKFDCPECGKKIQCDVHSVPEFELSKAQTPEEYKASLESARKIVAETVAAEKESQLQAGIRSRKDGWG